jgi:SagB-type dehydrogenase family enzyme
VSPMPTDPVAAVLAYHEQTKHRLPNRYARSLGFLDWDTQPNPFRLYAGSEILPLARDDETAGPSLDHLYDPTRIDPHPVNLDAIARLLYDSLALSAWKQIGEQRWSLRCNPSSGNLHPTEAYMIGEFGGFAELGEGPTLWHYTPLTHSLERRAALPPKLWRALRGDGEGVLVGLTSIVWREAWKYGERAFRYCQHDVGHALAALAYSAAALGWHVRVLASIDDAGAARLLGLEHESTAPSDPEFEEPDVVLFIGPRLPTHAPSVPDTLALTLEGRPNPLSEAHQPWPVLATVAHASRRIGSVTLARPVGDPSPEPDLAAEPTLARRLFRTRRSAVAFDGVTRLGRESWLRMLSRTLQRPGHAPLAGLLGRPRVHLLLFVHRVDDVEPGLYLLLREPSVREQIAAKLHGDFEWTQVDSGPLALPLWRLVTADTRNAAALVSCRQDIASDGCFALAMLAELEPAIVEHGAWMYRHLHWEAGAIGQILYIEAEAAQLRATGIGCFFDDAVHELLGLRDQSLNSIYHFTVGGPLPDERLRTLAAYHHLDPPG